MKNEKYIIGGIAAIILLLGIFIGTHLVAPQQIIQQMASASPAGTTNNTPRQALIVFAPATGTTTSILNTDANDRIIETAKIGCSGLGVSQIPYTGGGMANTGLIFYAATTSVANAATTSASNLIFDNSFTIATSTGFAYVSSTTPGVTGAVPASRIWAANSYLTISSNATNTGACSVGVSYLPE